MYRVPGMLPGEGLLCCEVLWCTGLSVHVEHGHRRTQSAQHLKWFAFERVLGEDLSSRPGPHLETLLQHLVTYLCLHGGGCTVQPHRQQLLCSFAPTLVILQRL